jgi:hypothetical protein
MGVGRNKALRVEYPLQDRSRSVQVVRGHFVCNTEWIHETPLTGEHQPPGSAQTHGVILVAGSHVRPIAGRWSSGVQELLLPTLIDTIQGFGAPRRVSRALVRSAER